MLAYAWAETSIDSTRARELCRCILMRMHRMQVDDRIDTIIQISRTYRGMRVYAFALSTGCSVTIALVSAELRRSEAVTPAVACACSHLS